MKPTKSESLAYLREVKEAFAKQDKIENFHHFVQLLQDFRTQKTDTEALTLAVKQLFQGHPHLLLGFDAFLPKEHQIITSQPRPHPPPAFRKAIDFVNKVKTRLQLGESRDDGIDVYESFINVMASYRMVSGSSKRKRNASCTTSSCESSDDDREATQVIYHKVAALFKDYPDLLQEFTSFLPLLPQDYRSYLEATTVKDKDQSRRRNCTPSYCLLPNNYSSIHCDSRRRGLESQVLNDSCVLRVPTTASTSVPKSDYEKSLFRYEDDMYELDMFLETVKSTSKRAEQLLDKIGDETGHQIRLEDHFTAMNLRCIERLYDDMGLEVLDVLRENAAVALPVIIARLKQKWEACCGFHRFWAQQSQTLLAN